MSKMAREGKSAYIVTEMFLRKSPDWPVSESRSPVPKASDTVSRRAEVSAKSLQVRPTPATVSDAENGVKDFGAWAKQRDYLAVQIVVKFDPQD